MNIGGLLVKKTFIVFMFVAVLLLSACSGKNDNTKDEKSVEIVKENLFNKSYYNTKIRSFDYFPFERYMINIKSNQNLLTVGFVNDIGLVDLEDDGVRSINLVDKTIKHLGINDMGVSLIHFIEENKIYYSVSIMSSNFITNNNSGVFVYDIEKDKVTKLLDIECTNGYFIKSNDSYYLYGNQIKYNNSEGDEFEVVRAMGHYRYSLDFKMLNDYSKLDKIKYITEEDGEIYYLTLDNKLFKASKEGDGKELLYDFKDRSIEGGLVINKDKLYLVESYDYKLVDRGMFGIATIPLSQIIMIDKDTKEAFIINSGEKMIYQVVSTLDNIYFSGREINNSFIENIRNSEEELLSNMDFGPSNLYKLNKEKAIEYICKINDVDIGAGLDKVFYIKESDQFIDSVVNRLKNKELSIGFYEEKQGDIGGDSK